MSAPERRFQGRPAAPGLAFGPLARLEPLRPDALTIGPTTPAAEERHLLEAMARARAELAQLAAANDDDLGAAVLEFQIELLADDALTQGVRGAIAGGAAAARAWSRGLDAEIASYAAAEDEHFRARASDLADLRDRVLRGFGCGGEVLAPLASGAIVLAANLTPSRFLEIDWRQVVGAALTAGSASSHTAMLARARGVPLVVGLGDAVAAAAEAILDGGTGELITEPGATTRAAYLDRLDRAARQKVRARRRRDRPAATVAGEPVKVMVNVDDPAAIDDQTLQASDGVGLMRTEFLFLGRDRLPGEDEQYAVYRQLLERLTGRPAIIRTLDLGGDKPLSGITLVAESNPFLGLRGLRLCLERPELIRPQIRALLRAACGRPLQIMLPMVTVAAELAEARALIACCFAELRRAGTEATIPPLGMMVETPAAALTIETFDAAFHSIGSNDLTQYVMAAARDAGGRVAALNDPRQPAVLGLIERVIAHGRRSGRAVGLCGDLASDPSATGCLLELGLRHFSVAPPALGRIKLAIAEFAAAAEGRRADNQQEGSR